MKRRYYEGDAAKSTNARGPLHTLHAKRQRLDTIACNQRTTSLSPLHSAIDGWLQSVADSSIESVTTTTTVEQEVDFESGKNGSISSNKTDSQSPSRNSQPRSASPGKKTNGAYRAIEMSLAGIEVDVNLPSSVEAFCDEILNASLSDQAQQEAMRSADAWKVAAAKLAAKPNIGEAEWVAELRRFLEVVLTPQLRFVEKRDFSPQLKPRVIQYINPKKAPLERMAQEVARETEQSEPIYLSTTDTMLRRPNSVPDTASITPNAPIFGPSPTLHPTSTPKSALVTPCPDITVAHDDGHLNEALRFSDYNVINKSHLLFLQQQEVLISDPGATPLGIRFPFFVVEVKSGATGGTLFQAQNQASVGCACALKILNGIQSACAAAEVDTNVNIPMICFSLLSEGPIYELWCHFQLPSSGFGSSCLGSYRISLDATELALRIAAIMQWASGPMHNALVDAVRRLL